MLTGKENNLSRRILVNSAETLGQKTQDPRHFLFPDPLPPPPPPPARTHTHTPDLTESIPAEERVALCY
jgi:hypothetical protein